MTWPVKLRLGHIAPLLAICSSFPFPVLAQAATPLKEISTEGIVCGYAFHVAQDCSSTASDNSPCPMKLVPSRAAKEFFPTYDVNLPPKEAKRLNLIFLQACRIGCGSRRAKTILPSKKLVCLQLGVSGSK